MAGKLTLVGTPIGNLGDMSPRALRALEEADFIAAEDTRVTLKLLNHFDIRRPLVSYYEHNAKRSGERILERILAGESCALVTDAGMPSISGPGRGPGHQMRRGWGGDNRRAGAERRCERARAQRTAERPLLL